MIILSLSAEEPPPSLRHPDAVSMTAAMKTATISSETILFFIFPLPSFLLRSVISRFLIFSDFL
jgi:hypothetical protein